MSPNATAHVGAWPLFFLACSTLGQSSVSHGRVNQTVRSYESRARVSAWLMCCVPLCSTTGVNIALLVGIVYAMLYLLVAGRCKLLIPTLKAPGCRSLFAEVDSAFNLNLVSDELAPLRGGRCHAPRKGHGGAFRRGVGHLFHLDRLADGRCGEAPEQSRNAVFSTIENGFSVPYHPVI